jgi:hypothetical protein
MMAARDQQDAMWAGGSGAPQGQIVVAPLAQGAKAQGAKAQGQAQGAKAQNRKNDMNTILQGDIGDD